MIARIRFHVAMMAAMVTCASGQATNHKTGAGRNIMELLRSLPSAAGFVDRIDAAGLADTLSGPGPFTIFAPSQTAIGGMPIQVSMDLYSQHHDPGYVAAVMRYHVASGNHLSTDLLPGTQVATLEGSSLGVQIQGGHEVQLIGEYSQALVTQADLVASNGVVHIIDTLLLPFESEREWQEHMRMHDQEHSGSGYGASTQPSGSKQCDDLESRVAIVNQACCDQLDDSYCSTGIPTACNSGCARVLLPLFADCIDAFGTSAPTFANQFAHIAATCAQACMNTCLDPATLNAVNTGFQRHSGH
eukprot:COSAG02_NODE_7692_length_2891_cov_2.813754_2_plen_302_part_00